MNDNDRFIVLKNAKEFVDSLDEYLINYPKKYYELRNRLVMDSYALIELIYLANYTKAEDRKPIQTQALMKVGLIDFYIEQSYKRKIISERQSIRLSKKLMVINKLLKGWMDNEKC